MEPGDVVAAPDALAGRRRGLQMGVMRILSVNVGRPRIVISGGRQYSTAINRRPAAGPVALGPLGLEGDRSSDSRHHGGVDKAVCCYPHEHYSYFAERLGRELSTPSFGENFTTQGLLETDVCIGDVYRAGGALVQVTQPRQPCHKLAGKHDEPRLIAWINETLFTGFYLRVLAAGRAGAGDSLELLDRPHPDLPIAFMMQTILSPAPPRELVERLGRLEALSASWRKSMTKKLAGDAVD